MPGYQSPTVPSFLHLTNLRRGRCGLDPFDLIQGQVIEALNVDAYDGMIGRKRPGSDSVALTGGTAFTGPMNALVRWVPGTDETAAQLFGFDAAATPLFKRLSGGTAWVDTPMQDAITSRAQDLHMAPLNGKAFLAYTSGQARMHVYDPANGVPVRGLLVGGGGGAGSGDATGRGGGGGGGEVLSFSELVTTTFVRAVVIGPGGAGYTAGTASTYNGLTAHGGGHGGAVADVGGGGGAGGGDSTTVAGAAGAHGGNGSSGRSNASPDSVGGGGGGAGGNAGASSSGQAGAGGPGISSSITGAAVTYGDGGGGGAVSGGGVAGAAGGTGGGAGSAAGGGASAAANRGGGGGGGKEGAANGGSGGSGVYILRYQTGSLTVSYSGTSATTTSGGDTILTCTTSGNLTISALTPPVRRVGLAPGANAPTAANTGSGAYTATLRDYRVRWVHLNGSAIIRRSEPTPALAFTPSGAGTGVVVTQPTPPGEGETHWEVEASLDGVLYYVIAGVNSGTVSGSSAILAIGTTTFTDAIATTSYASCPASDPSGYYTLPPACQYVVSDGNRLIMAGDPLAPSRIYLTSVLGSADKGDDERIVVTSFQKGYLDIGLKDGGGIVGLAGPINGVIYVFKTRAVWGLYPTNDVTGPYIFKKIRSDIGLVDQNTVTYGRDVNGNATIHFWDGLTGLWRISAQSGFEYLGRDVEDITPTVNLVATNKVAHATWLPHEHQCWVWLATGAANDPNVIMVYDPAQSVRDSEGMTRGGWYKFTGDLASARCSCLFANTLGASMSLDLKPHAGLTTGTAKVYKGNSDTAKDDAGVAFQSYLDSGVILPPLQENATLATGDPILTAKASAATVRLTIEGNFDPALVRTSDLDLTAAGTETRVFRKFQDAKLAGLTAIQVRLGDSVAVSSAWTLDRLSIPIQMEAAP